MIKVGNCGWGFAPVKAKEKGVKTKLQAYAKHFNVVEVNYTFYKVPKLATVTKWREEVDAVTKEFEFSLKIFKDITHLKRFGKESIPVFETQSKIAKALRTKVILFQCPKSFTPEAENLKRLEIFFKNIDRKDFILVLEVRWRDQWTEEIVNPLFKELEINQCVDPFRQDCFYAKDIIYYRLHGLGPRMYDYKFSDKELNILYKKIKDEKRQVYILFNNFYAYDDANRFTKLVVQNA
ncbi:MAG: DUF72 domain-containing protein [bacterium]|nr:DUF72 domain-containing protein [bacterium]